VTAAPAASAHIVGDRTVGDVAELVRSKNAGPFWQTFDIFCGDDAAYAELAAADVITPQRIGASYDVDPDVVLVFRMPNIRVIKVSIPRPVSSGSVLDRDVHAGQQHVPLMLLPVCPTR
jgi:hypothetical protein